MPIFKRNPFGHILFLKRWLIRIFGVVSHGRYRRFNSLQIEGSEIIRDLPDTNLVTGVKDKDPFLESFKFVLPGYNVRPLEMSGAIGVEQLKKLPEFLVNRR